MSETVANPSGKVSAADILHEQELGARQPDNRYVRAVLLGTALLWSVFQLWIASPLPYVLGVLVWNDTQIRAIHLAFAVFLAYTAFPTLGRSPRNYVPVQDWVLGLLAAASSGYLWLFYAGVAARSGAPSTADVVTAGIGVVLLLEAARRSLGAPLMVVAAVFLAYVFFGHWAGLPDVIRWRGASFERAMSHMWLSTEGVFGVALGVSSSFVFLFVLFGALLNQAGAGNYFVQMAFSLLGHMRGGPAKAAVVSSAMTGLISGSSISNVVTTGTFTIPLMKRVGFSSTKAGAVEVSSSINGVLTPPIMGAVAFLMTEYVGVPYVEVIKTAIVPALISYLALIYIVHLEALRHDMHGLERPDPLGPAKARAIRAGLTISGILVLAGAVYWLIEGLKLLFGDISFVPILGFLFLVYLGLLRRAARKPDLEIDDPNAPVIALPRFSDVAATGTYYVIPVLVLVWFLIVEWKSPAYSAFMATCVMIFMIVTQKPLKAMFRDGESIVARAREGFSDLTWGLIAGARNMIGLACAMGVAGLIVGTVTLTGIGQVMAEFVEFLSGGNLLLMLFFVAVICIVLGMGLPTTANYIVVSSLMAGVVVELGAQSGLIVPLIAVHMFVFYYGIMADVTPPVGLASFAAAAISRGEPMRTGVQAFFYSLRTALLPFLFIFNTDLLLIDVGPVQAVLVFLVALVAMLVFAASTMGHFLTRSRLWESLALFAVAMTLFRPDFLLNQVSPQFETLPPAAIHDIAETAPADAQLRVIMEGYSLDGDFVSSTYLFPLGDDGREGTERLRENAGMELAERDGRLIVDSIRFGSPAERAGVDFDWEVSAVEVERARPAQELFFIPAFGLLLLVVASQRRRMRRTTRLEGAATP